MRKTGPTQKFGKSYGAAMKKARAWSSVDVLSVHLYPPAKEGPATRVAYIKKTKSYYRKYGAGKKPLWDTEMNFGDLRSYMKVKRAYTGTAAQTYVARTFIDSMRYGVQRVFWYGWDFNVLGTAMTQGGTLREGGVAFQEVRSWMSGKQWLGCKVKSSVTLCRVAGPTGVQYIAYASKAKTMKVPAGVRFVELLDGTEQSVGSTYRITQRPVLLRG
jgi:hypothetical protein